MRDAIQVSESMTLGFILALSGGFMDAYSYIGRGHVFANAQTGNLILLGIHLSEGNFSQALIYLCPPLAFGAGIALAEALRRVDPKLHWRQIAVLVEAVILAYVASLAQSQNLLANSLTSFACGVQVQSFRKIHGNGAATTMCIGNLRSATHHMVSYVATKDEDEMRSSLLYYSIILFFVSGAVLGYKIVIRFHERAILVSCVLLVISFVLMFTQTTKDEKARM